MFGVERWVGVLTACLVTTGNHDRPGYAKYFAAGAGQSPGVAGPHEEPDGADQDCEAHQCWYY